MALESVGGFRRSYVEHLGPQISAQLNSELGAFSFRGTVPLIATFVAGHAERRSELMSVALEVRNSASARRFRKWASRVQTAIDGQTQLQVIRDAREELIDLCSDIRKELRFSDSPVTEVTMKLAAPAGVFSLDIPARIQAGLPQWINRILYRRSHLKFLRDLALSEIEFAPFELRYGNLRA